VSAAAGDNAPERLAEILGHRFERLELLTEAVTHSSALMRAGGRRRAQAAGGPGRAYERLEFLGDRVLGLVVAELLWRRYPDEAEGPLTQRHASLVRREALVVVARALDLGRFIILSAGEEAAQTRRNAGILADVCEAVIAALYLDGGLAAAEAFIRRHWEPLLEEHPQVPRDPKTALQEWVQARGLPLPRYEIVGTEGPAHARRFSVRVSIDGFEPQVATGSSKRAAEIAAASTMIALLPSVASEASP
jgi:ribonuclease-3